MIERIRSKVILTYPRNVEIVDFTERLLSWGYSSVHTRLGFNTEIFTPKSPGFMNEKDRIIEQMKNLCGEENNKSEKEKLNKRLYELLKQEDLKSSNKPIYSLRLDREEESHKRRVLSKIFKLDKNNQYRFAMTNLLPTGTFKREPEANMEILNRSVEKFDFNSKVGKIFVVDIRFDGYNNP